MNDSERNNDTTPAPEKTISDDMLIIVPVRNLVLFPGTVVPVAINRERSLAAAQEAVRAERKVGFVLQHDPDLTSPTGSDLYKVGTVASIVRYVTGQDGTHHQGHDERGDDEFDEREPRLQVRACGNRARERNAHSRFLDLMLMSRAVPGATRSAYWPLAAGSYRKTTTWSTSAKSGNAGWGVTDHRLT